ncbi:hypothetical protein LEMLEM_LOCUS18638 [Lemmus lemmus]
MSNLPRHRDVSITQHFPTTQIFSLCSPRESDAENKMQQRKAFMLFPWILVLHPIKIILESTLYETCQLHTVDSQLKSI